MEERKQALGNYDYAADMKAHSDDGSLDLLSLEYLVDTGACVLGTPDQCLDACKRYEAAGVDLLLCLVNPYKIGHEQVMQTIDLMGKHVIPVVRLTLRQVVGDGIAHSRSTVGGDRDRVGVAAGAQHGAGRAPVSLPSTTIVVPFTITRCTPIASANEPRRAAGQVVEQADLAGRRPSSGSKTTTSAW